VSYKIAISARLIAATSVPTLAVGIIVSLFGGTGLGALLVLLAFIGFACSLGLMAMITVPLGRQLARRTGLKIKLLDPWLL
jgi:ACR3 family arsenite efflux pump ArsB